MLKLFFASSAMIPVIFMSLNVKAENSVSPPRAEGLSYAASIEQKIDDMSHCQSGEIPVYFHDAYITQHSAELINTASDVTRNCEIESLKVTYYNNGESVEIMSERENQIKLYLRETSLKAPLESKVEEGQRDSLWLNGRRAVIEIKLNPRSELVVSS